MSLADLARTPAKSKARSLTDLASKPASGNGFWGAIGQGVQSAERAVGGVVSGALNSQPVRDTARWGIETVSNPDIALMNALSVLGRTNRAGIVAAHDAKGGNGFLNAAKSLCT
jgi:hypothetical protein